MKNTWHTHEDNSIEVLEKNPWSLILWDLFVEANRRDEEESYSVSNGLHASLPAVHLQLSSQIQGLLHPLARNRLLRPNGIVTSQKKNNRTALVTMLSRNSTRLMTMQLNEHCISETVPFLFGKSRGKHTRMKH